MGDGRRSVRHRETQKEEPFTSPCRQDTPTAQGTHSRQICLISSHVFPKRFGHTSAGHKGRLRPRHFGEVRAVAGKYL